MDKKHRGAVSELSACAWLLENGYEVFRNVSQHGTTDLVVIKYALVLRIDVKTAGVYVAKDGEPRYYCSHKPAPGVRILAALPNGEFKWQDQLGSRP